MVCRVFKKKNYHKALESPTLPRNDGVLDQLIMYMGSRSNSCKQETDPGLHFPNPSTGFLHLPELESPTMNMNNDCAFKPLSNEPMHEPGSSSEPSDWATLDRLVASQLNGQNPKPFSSYGDEFSFSFESEDQVQQLMNMNGSDDHRGNETDLWTFARSSSSLSSSSSDPLCHLSV